jgi:Protein of unknown function (DUF5818)
VTGARPLIAIILAAASVSAGQESRTFTGIITDNLCVRSHEQMQMGPTDADCTIACVRGHGAAYVLFDGKTAYTLSDQRAPEKFAGQKVRVVGSLDAAKKTIRVESIAAAK